MAGKETNAPEITRRRFIAFAVAGSSFAALARLGGRHALAAPSVGTPSTPSPTPTSTPSPTPTSTPIPPPVQGTLVRLTTDLGIPASPSIDVSDAITQALIRYSGMSLNQGTPTVLLEGCYRINHAVRLNGLRNLRIAAGPGSCGFRRYHQRLKPATWPVKTPFYSYLDVRDSEDLVLEGFHVQGPLLTATYNSTLEEAAGISIAGASRRVTVRGVTITGVHGDFIIVAEDHRDRPTGVLVENVTGNIAGRQMIADVGGNGLTVKTSTFKYSARSAIDIEPSTPLGSANITIEDSLFDTPQLYCLAGGGEPPHRNVVVRRTAFYGGKGLVKYGPPDGYPLGSHVGLTLEDVTYQWRPGNGSMGINIARTQGIVLQRVYARMLGEPGRISGTGSVSNSTFISDSHPGPVVYLCGVTSISNVGIGPCVQPEGR